MNIWKKIMRYGLIKTLPHRDMRKSGWHPMEQRLPIQNVDITSGGHIKC